MTPEERQIKILTTLSLAGSDTRTDTLASVILYSLQLKEKPNLESLCEEIKNVFGFEPYQEEILSLLKALVNDGKIVNDRNEYSLTSQEIERLNIEEQKLKDRDRSRLRVFREFIHENLQEDVSTEEVKELWSAFLSHIYNSFFHFGQEAAKILHPQLKNDDDSALKYNSLVTNTISGFKKHHLKKVLRQSIERFPDYATQDDIDFINELAQKTISFSSLGFDPSNPIENPDIQTIDWVLYLDTNVLYSILNLHDHPENDSVNALLKLIIENKAYLSVKLRYSTVTQKELRFKRNDFTSLDENLSDSAIKAILRSEQTDPFTEKYLKNLLLNRDNTLHPKTVIEFSGITLKEKFIEIGQDSKEIEHLGETFLQSKVTEYYGYLSDYNQTLEEFNERKGRSFNPITKGEKQVLHDVTLREVILYRRSKNSKDEHSTMNSMKYFGLTLDETLLRFDKKMTKESGSSNSIPIFFKPSFLLNRLIRVLPIKTEDYKRAFVKAITTSGFHRDSSNTREVLKIVNYLKNLGIDNERILFSVITDRLFLKEFSKIDQNDEDNQKLFIESQLNQEFEKLQNDLNRTKESLTIVEDKAFAHENENKVLKEKTGLLEKDLIVFKEAIKKIHNKEANQKERKELSHKSAGLFDFDPLKEKNKLLLETKKDLLFELNDKISALQSEDLKKWKRIIWLNWIWGIPLIILSLLILLNKDIFGLIELLKANDSFQERLTISSIIASPILFIGYLFWDRYLNEMSKGKRKENFKVPKELNSKRDLLLEEIENLKKAINV